MKRIYIITISAIIGGITGCLSYKINPGELIAELVNKRNHTHDNIEISANKEGVTIPVTIGDTTIMMFWDTGADRTIIDLEIADKLNIKYDTTSSSLLTVFSKNLIKKSVQNDGLLDIETIKTYTGENVWCKIGDKRYILQPLILPQKIRGNPNILGTDFLHQYFYAVHLTDNKLSLSTAPLSFAEFDIVDSLIFRANNTQSKRPVSKVNVKSDSLDLLLDSGMCLDLGKDRRGNHILYYDIVLCANDTTGVSYKAFKEIGKQPVHRISYYYNDVKSFDLIYDSLFTVNSHQITTYLPFFTNNNNDAYHGYISYGFIARFDIFYYDPQSRTAKLYKVKDYKPITRDVSIWEVSERLKRINDKI